MVQLTEVHIGHRDLRALEPHLGRARIDEALEAAERFRAWMGGRTIWNINTTAVGGGVAEMLEPLLAYSRSVGVRIRWLVIDGNPEFFKLTKRIHHALHGSRGDGSPLGDEQRATYERTLSDNASALESYVERGDVVILHDPQTAGLAPALLERGVQVIWRCHIGHDTPGEEVDRGWAFLTPYLEPVPVYVFSRRDYAPEHFGSERTHIIQPSIDALSPKNQSLDEKAVHAILAHVGLVEAPTHDGPPEFVRSNGSTARVQRTADIWRSGAPPSYDTPVVAQISRWDPLKDMLGVMRGFAQLLQDDDARGAHLLLVGPDVRGVTDDPEGPRVFEEVHEVWEELPERARDRITLCMLPTADVEENAAIVNAIQRHAAVVVQKSLHEGFGLTVTEAMWKSRPMIASAVGGIRDQIEHEVHGLLLDDPTDLRQFQQHLARLLGDPELARRYGEAARERVREKFLGIRHLLQYAELIPHVGS